MTEIERVFPVVCAEAFDEAVAIYGFSRGAANTKPTYCSQQYLNGARYIDVTATVDFRDYPLQANVILGEGSTEWPESDWNHIGLWRLVESEFPKARAEGACDYGIGVKDDIAKTFPPLFKRMRDDLLRYAQPYLLGDMKIFRRIRAAQTRERDPYFIFENDGKGGLTKSIHEGSQSLKERFSREEG